MQRRTGRSSSTWPTNRAQGIDFNSPEDIWDDMRRVTPSMAGISYERIEKPEALHWPCPTLEHPGTPILHREKFSSADGLGHFFGIEHRRLRRSLTKSIRSP